jgi:hypothetical protein
MDTDISTRGKKVVQRGLASAHLDRDRGEISHGRSGEGGEKGEDGSDGREGVHGRGLHGYVWIQRRRCRILYGGIEGCRGNAKKTVLDVCIWGW